MTSSPSGDLDQLKRALVALRSARARIDELEQRRAEPIAIVGIGLRAPGGVTSPAQFWELLATGRDAVTEVPADHWNIDAYYSADGTPGTVPSRFGGFLTGIDQFDPQFFGISPREAHAMDPQQRLVLETAWEALEDANVVPQSLAGSRTGVFIGMGLNDYSRLQVEAQQADPGRIESYFIAGNALCITANRVSYTLDLRGPSLVIDTACSSSLVALHQACASLRTGESTLALAGGANVILDPTTSISLAKFLAPDGRCKFGDARADGYVRAEGAAVVVLKRLSDAVRDGDSIYAVVRGSAVNQDGYSSGLTVPNGVAQEALLRDALASAGVAAGDVDYVEAHGTGTALGDPIEANALGGIYGPGRSRPLAIGSLKTSIGHLEAAAGIGGVIKVALALKHGQIPPSLHFDTPNPLIDFDALQLTVQRTLGPWPTTDRPALAGVSSFGFGGVNAHAILEAPPAADASATPADDRPVHVLTLSAKSPAALRELGVRYARDLEHRADSELAAVCRTAATDRSAHPYRLALAGTSAADLARRLRAPDEPGNVYFGEDPRPATGQIGFLFPGQGAQYVGMARELYAAEPRFCEIVDRAAAVLSEELDHPLLDVLFGSDSGPSALVHQTAFTQPCLFVVEYALAQLWMAWGVRPDVVLGHSVGEYVAACVAGVFSFEDGLRLIAARGRLMQALPPAGAMAAIFGDEASLAPLVAATADRVSIAAVNGPAHVVISGDRAAVTDIAEQFRARGVRVVDLEVSHAFHSPLLDPMLDAFEDVARSFAYRPPTIPLVSNVTGRLWEAGRAPDAAYWRRHAREAVRFADGFAAARAAGTRTFVDVGPHPVLLGLGQGGVPEHEASEMTWLPSLRRGKPAWPVLLDSLARLAALGVPIDWMALDHGQARRPVHLPTYPFQHERYWWDELRKPTVRRGRASAGARMAGHPMLGEAFQSPAVTGTVFQSELDTEAFPILDEHRVHGRAILPATAFVELALAASADVLDPGARIDELVIHSPLVLTDEPRPVQVLRESQGPHELALRIVSRQLAAGSDVEWRTHATARVSGGHPVSGPADVDLEAIRAACPTPLTAAEFYAQLAETGLAYGPDFQGVQHLWHAPGAALGNVRVPSGVAAELSDYALHPAVLDACLQVVAALFPEMTDAGDGACVPLGLEGVRVYRTPEPELWSHATALPSAASGATLAAQVRVFTDRGELVAEIQKASFRRISRQALLESTPEADREMLYEVTWQPAPRAAAAEGSGPRQLLLVAADDDPLTDPLVARLRAAGTPCTVTAPGADALPATAAPDAVIYLAPPVDPAAAPDTVQHAGCGGLLALVQAMDAHHVAAPVWVVTAGAQAVSPGEALAVSLAPLWGMGRTIAREYPALRPVLFDLDPTQPERSLAVLVAELAAGHADDEVAVRAGMRHVARLTPVAAAGTPRDERVVELTAAGSGTLDGLALTPASRRQPGPGEVELQVRAHGLNFRDVLKTLGMYAAADESLGDECAGVVVAVGPDVAALAVGDAVMAIVPASLRSFVTVAAQRVARLPAGVGFDAAATLPIAFGTAYHALVDVAGLAPGERVLVHAGAGGVGLAAIQLAQARGAQIFATAGSEAKRAYLRSLGVEHVLDSRTLEFAAEIERRTNGEGVDVVLNSLADEFIPASLRVLRRGGRFLELGKRGIWDPARVATVAPTARYTVIDLGATCERDPVYGHTLLQTLVDRVVAGELRPLPLTRFPLAQASDAFRFMAQARHIGKIVLTEPFSPPVTRPTIRADATYLITGGLGGLGLQVASDLVAQGARHLVLLGRSTPSPAAAEAVAALAASGAHVHTRSADVAQAADVARVLGEIAATMPPLRGIVHAAGVLDDGVLAQQTWPRFERVMAPKIAGAWHLHTQTLDDDLDFFVLFSAGTVLVGPAGQASYAAANAFLDALAQQRQVLGRPALSINWGPWREHGMAAALDARQQAHFAQLGLGSLNSATAVRLLRRLRDEPHANVAVLPLDWAAFARGPLADRTLFADHLARQAAARPGPVAAAPAPPELRQLVHEAPADRRRSVVLGAVRQRVYLVLGVDDAHGVATDVPLGQVGLDSLMAVELRNALATMLGRSLPVTLLFDYPTIDAVTDYVLADLAPPVASAAGPEPSPGGLAASTSRTVVETADVATLSEDEAEALLLAELALIKGGR